MRRNPAAGSALVVAGAGVAVLATLRTSPGTRTVALAVVGGVLVATSELAVRLADRRRWVASSTPPEHRIPIARDLAPPIAWAVVGGAVAWLLVVGMAGAALRGWSVIAAGGIAVVVVLATTALLPTPPQGSSGASRRRPTRAPSPRGRRRGRGTTPARPVPPAPPGSSS